MNVSRLPNIAYLDGDELEQLIEQAQEQLAARRAIEKAALLEDMRETAGRCGFQLEELFGPVH
jgi:hypothetical protein